MPFGVNLFLWTAGYTDNEVGLVIKVKELGFDVVEIPLDFLDAISVEKTKKALEETGLQVIGCA
ncbi:MAG: sugar phosphate isomerase/epimerase, partial [Atribacterota bacterium]